MPKNLILKNVYRNGRTVKMAFRDGELIYQMVTRLVFNVDTDSLSFDPDGETKTITITTNDDWTMTVPEWITASSLSGYTGATISLTAGSTESGRTGNIVITCGGKSHTVSVDQVVDYSSQYLTFRILTGGTIVWKAGVSATTRTIQYSINNGNWVSITSSTGGTSFNVSPGDVVRFKGNNSTYCTASANTYSNRFDTTTASFNVCGNIMSMISGDNFQDTKTFSSTYVFRSFLSGLKVLDASNLLLPATALTEGCYMSFFGDSTVTKSPKLPATSLAKNCYWNFLMGATNITSAPELPATTLAESCYRAMFYGCTSLTTAPVLPATTLKNYCYYQMFQGCSNLTYIKCLATSVSASGAKTNWVSGVSASGTFVKSPNITTSTWGSGISGIPQNWTVEDAVL